MSPLKPYQYDAFISYSSKDRPWAKQLADDLSARQLKVFYDRTNLDVGDKWEGQLDDNLERAQHLIVLWSKNADLSRYVEYERTYFHAKARPSNTDSNQPPRREIIILLDDQPVVVRNTLQMIPQLKEARAYENGFENLDSNVWQEVVAQAEKAIRNQSNATRILVAVVATTRDSLNRVDFDKEYKGFGTVNSVLSRMGINSKAELLEYYGQRPDDWCPFGKRLNIWTVLEKLKVRVAQATNGAVQIEWIPIGKDFWSNDIDAARLEAQRLVRELSLVVIDPISLVDGDVKDMLDLIQGCFANSQSAIMVLTPFQMLEPSATLREIIQSRAMSLSNLFYQPPVPPSSSFANFGINIGDEIDMNRLVLITLGQHFGTQKGTNQWTEV